MSTKDLNNLVDLGDEQGFSALGDRLTFNPAAEESTSDSAPKNISNDVELKVSSVMDDIKGNCDEDDDENVTTGVLEWPGAGVRMPIIPVANTKAEEKADYEIINVGEFDIEDLPSAERHEVEFDQQFHQLENLSLEKEIEKAVDLPFLDDEDDSGPSARIFNVLEEKFTSDIPPSAPANLTMVPPAYIESAAPRLIDEDITVDLKDIQGVWGKFMDSHYFEDYKRALNYYKRVVKTSNEPLRPPKIENFFKTFSEEIAKKENDKKPPINITKKKGRKF